VNLNLADALVAAREDALALRLRDPAAAEAAQKRLIERCRLTIGPVHPFTLAVRSDLCLTLLVLDRGELAKDVAYDLADIAAQHLGSRDPATAETQVRALFIVMCTSAFEECVEFGRSRLEWLAEEDPRGLDPELEQTRREYLELTGREPERGAG
jgi:hypothetical protein